MKSTLRTVLISLITVLSAGRLESGRIERLSESDWIPLFIRGCCQVYGIEERVAVGVIRTESSGRAEVKSWAGAIGLMQVLPSTARWLCRDTSISVKDLQDPFQNIRIGLKYLSLMKRQHHNNLRIALLCYNRGPGTVRHCIRTGTNPDNGYYAKVMQHAGDVQSLVIQA